MKINQNVNWLGLAFWQIGFSSWVSIGSAQLSSNICKAVSTMRWRILIFFSIKIILKNCVKIFFALFFSDVSGKSPDTILKCI